jgi:hypothetical protein
MDYFLKFIPVINKCSIFSIIVKDSLKTALKYKPNPLYFLYLYFNVIAYFSAFHEQNLIFLIYCI